MAPISTKSVVDHIRTACRPHEATLFLSRALRRLARGRSAWRSFRRDRVGNIALLFGLLLPPMIGCIGLAIDFGSALTNKNSMQMAADAATLAGAKAASDYLAKNGTGATEESAAISLGNRTAQQFFLGNVKLAYGKAAGMPTVTTNMVEDLPTVTLKAQNDYQPIIASIFGTNVIPVAVTSTTTMTLAKNFYQIIFVVDVSGSMSVGGDPSTIATMQSIGSFRCAFACHDPNNLQNIMATDYADASPMDWFVQQTGAQYCPYGNKSHCKNVLSTVWADKRALARRYGYKLKIDYVNSAISSFISQLQAADMKYAGKNYYSVGINTFGSNADNNRNPFNMLLAPTTDFSAATKAAGMIDVEAVTPVASTNWGYTRTTVGLTSTLAKLQNVGDGASPTSRMTFVVFLTDGVQDVEGGQIWGRQANANYTDSCTAIKNAPNSKNAKVSMFSIWTHYYAIPNDDQYNILVNPLQSKMPDAMKACASSPDQYFEASDGTGIAAAVASVFDKIVKNSSLRLTTGS